MSIYQRIFITTSKRFASSGLISKSVFSPERLLWAVPAGVAFTWFIFGALTDDIKQSVGLYWDPDADVNKVEMERAKRLEARAALKPKKPAKDDDDDDDEESEEEDGEEEVTAETVAAAVAKAVEAGDDDEEEDEKESDDDDEEEEEEPKKPKVNYDSLSTEGKWDFLASKFVEPGDDDEDDDDDDADDDDADDDDAADDDE